MATKQELEQQIKDAEAQAQKGHETIEQGRKMQHDATAKINEARAQINQLEEANNNGQQ